LPTVIDARIPPPPDAVRLAPRKESLGSETVILFDNDKLKSEYGPYQVIFDIIGAELSQRYPGVELQTRIDDLLVGGIDRLGSVADEIATSGAAGVVIALCDWGVSQPTAIFAAELERRGVPTSIVATEVGSRQVTATAQFLAPGLPVSTIHAIRGTTAVEIESETRRVLDQVVEGIVASTDRLLERFNALDLDPPPMGDGSGLLEIHGEDLSIAFTLAMEEVGLGDGMPLIAPTPERVEAFLAAAGLDPEVEVWTPVPPRTTPVTGREVAAVAVMAGCRRRWAPVVAAAFHAMSHPGFRLFQSAITTHPSGTFVFVSGPDTAKYGIATGRGCLGPGFAANATVGRAVSLAYSFLLGSQPGRADLTSQGSPAEYSYCCGENLAESPWKGLHADIFDDQTTTVTVLKCEGPHNLLEDYRTDPTGILDTFASSMATLGANNAYVAGAQVMLMLNPDHARMIAKAGWAKTDVQSYLYDVARNPSADLAGRGIGRIQPRWFGSAERVPVVPDPSDFLVTVVGGGGPASQFATPWGYSRAATVPIG
jgi:hypothetical protein